MKNENENENNITKFIDLIRTVGKTKIPPISQIVLYQQDCQLDPQSL